MGKKKVKKPKSKCCAKFRKKGKMCGRCPLRANEAFCKRLKLKKKKQKNKDKK